MTKKIYTYFPSKNTPSLISKIEINADIITVFYKAAWARISPVEVRQLSFDILGKLQGAKYTLVGTEENGFPVHKNLHIDKSDLSAKFGGDSTHVHFKIPSGTELTPEHLKNILDILKNIKRGKIVGIDPDSADIILENFRKDFISKITCPEKERAIYRGGRDNKDEVTTYEKCAKRLKNGDFPGRENYPFPPEVYQFNVQIPAMPNRPTLLSVANNPESANNSNAIAAAAGGLVILGVFAASYIYKKFFTDPATASVETTENATAQKNIPTAQHSSKLTHRKR